MIYHVVNLEGIKNTVIKRHPTLRNNNSDDDNNK